MTNQRYAIAGILAPAIFLITYLIASSLRPEYNLYTKAISELGSLHAPNKWFWNIFGYILPGILVSIFSIGLYKEISAGKASKYPLAGIFLSGVFMAIAGIFPGDFDNKQSMAMLLHTFGSLGSYVFFLLGAFTYVRLMKKSAYWQQAIKPTLIFTWLTIIFGSWPFIFPDYPAVGQRMVFMFYFLWIGYTAYKMFIKLKMN